MERSVSAARRINSLLNGFGFSLLSLSLHVLHSCLSFLFYYLFSLKPLPSHLSGSFYLTPLLTSNPPPLAPFDIILGIINTLVAQLEDQTHAERGAEINDQRIVQITVPHSQNIHMHVCNQLVSNFVDLFVFSFVKKPNLHAFRTNSKLSSL